MPLKLMYITNDPQVAQIAESVGVDRVFVDMEYIGKSIRQGGMDTVQSRHTVDDIRRIRAAVSTAQVMARVNPVHDATAEYTSTEEEVGAAIDAGAEILMLPYFKTVAEVRRFIRAVNHRAKTLLLLETAEAVSVLDDILEEPGIDEIHIGLNDLSLSYGLKFMFQLLADGTVENLCGRIRRKGITYGFGGIAALGRGMLPAELIIREHYRLGSTGAILSRSFCNTSKITDLEEIRATFAEGVPAIRALERECEPHSRYFADNLQLIKDRVEEVLAMMSSR